MGVTDERRPRKDLAMTPELPGIIFMHVPRTGGLTLRRFLTRRYGRAAFPHSDGDAHPIALMGALPQPDRGGNERYLEALSALPEERRAVVRVYIGHFTYGIHQQLPEPSTYFTVLRDPIDRTLSAYNWHRVGRWSESSLREFLTHPLTVGDQQTRRIAGGEWARGSSDTNGMLEVAKQHLVDDFAVVGLKERWEETLLVLADTFGWPRPYYHTYNELPGRPVREGVPDDVVEILGELNRIDYELYRFATSRFDEQLRRDFPDVAGRLRRLRRGNVLWKRVDPHMQRMRRTRYVVRSTAARTFHRVVGR